MTIPEQLKVISKKSVAKTLDQLDLTNLLIDEKTDSIMRALIGAAKRANLAGREIILAVMMVKLRDHFLPLVNNSGQPNRVYFCTYLLELLYHLSESPAQSLLLSRMRVIESFYQLYSAHKRHFFPEPAGVRHSCMRRALALVGLFNNLYATDEGKTKLDGVEWRAKLSKLQVKVSRYPGIKQPGDSNDLRWLILRSLHGERIKRLSPTVISFLSESDDMTDSTASVSTSLATAVSHVSDGVRGIAAKARVIPSSVSVASREKDIKAITHGRASNSGQQPVKVRKKAAKKREVKPRPPKVPPPHRLAHKGSLRPEADDRDQGEVTPRLTESVLCSMRGSKHRLEANSGVAASCYF